MTHKYVPLCAVVILLGGCAGGSDLSVGAAADPAGAPRGYLYHDGNHSNRVVGPSPQAIYNATHGTWLWPPAEEDRPS